MSVWEQFICRFNLTLGMIMAVLFVTGVLMPDPDWHLAYVALIVLLISTPWIQAGCPPAFWVLANPPRSHRPRHLRRLRCLGLR